MIYYGSEMIFQEFVQYTASESKPEMRKLWEDGGDNLDSEWY